MKIIYLTNGIYEQNILENNIQIINKKEKNNNELYNQLDQEQKIIVYGGNQFSSDIKIKDDLNTNYTSQINKINKINDKFTKYILYGSLDMDINTNCIGLTKSIEVYKKDRHFFNIFGIDYKLINSNTIVIFINNFFNITDNLDTNITSTCFKHLISLEPTKYNENMKIRDLIELEMNELSSVIKKNINVKTIIFFTQSPLVVPDYIHNTLRYIELFNKYSYLLNDLNLFWICGDLIPRNEYSTIRIVKKDNTGNKISELIVKQYIIGLNLNNISSNESDSQVDMGIDMGIEIGIDMSIDMSRVNLDETNPQFEINYKINEVNKNNGYLELGVEGNNIKIKFIDTNKIVDNKKSKLEDLKKKIISKNILGENVLNNIELSISDSSNEDIYNQLTEEGDPYKSKYLKYKKKLYKLRNNKKQ